MNIAMGIRYFRAVGGAEKVTRRLAEHLAAAGHRVDVYAYQADRSERIDVHPLRNPRGVPRAMRDWATGKGLSRALAGSGADVTFGEQKTWGADVIRPGGGVEDEYWISRMPYARVLRHPAGRFVHPKRYFDVRAEKNGYVDPSLRRVIVNSRMIRDQLTTRYPHLEGRIAVIYNGVDEVPAATVSRDAAREELGARFGMRGTALWVLFAGHEFKRKGLRHALGAVAKARAAGVDAQMVVVGRDRAAPFIRERNRLGLASDVHFAGSVDDLRLCYSAADALILPSFYDPFANVTIEAMGAGLPVITTRRNGGSELVDAASGWVVDNPRAEGEMAGAIGALADTARRTAMGDAARAMAGKHLLKDKMAEMAQVLSVVAEEKAGGAGA